MKLSFRWYGPDDKVTLENIRQIPGMHSIVTAVYDVPVGEVWSEESIAALKKQVEDAGLHFEVIEAPVSGQVVFEHPGSRGHQAGQAYQRQIHRQLLREHPPGGRGRNQVHLLQFHAGI